ncbi:MAG: hypothetical protein OES38_13715 [Gammaproteobacteria bacterium]|nr:hypothetical protein [Gammaproteobacteria bacterium]
MFAKMLPDKLERILGALFLGTLIVPAIALASVYRCSSPDGPPMFSQFPCATPGEVDTMVITAVSVVSAPPLSTSEQATLARMQQRFERSRTEAAKQQRRARQRSLNDRSERIAECARSRNALKALRERRRGGYSLSTSRSLNAEEARLKAQASEHC